MTAKEDTRLSGFALWLITEDTQPFTHIAASLVEMEPSSPVFDPHITLLHLKKAPAIVSDISSALRQAIFRASNAGFHRGPMRLLPVQRGSQYYQSVLVPVDPNSSLTALRRHCEEAFDCPNAEYFPHVSLQYGHNTDARRQELVELVQRGHGGIIPQEVMLKEVWVVKVYGEVEDWQVVDTIQL